jgi:Mrp family chromosome partitioning ATPase
LQGTSPSPQRDVQLSIALNDLARTQQRLTTAINALEEARVGQAGAGDVLTLPEPAAVPTQAVLPRVAINVFSAAVVGLLVAVLIGLVLDLLFDRRAPLADLADAAGVATVVGETGRGSVVVTGANPSANSASAAIDLAMARARAGNRVILVDANLYQPRLSELLALDARRGLTNLLSNPARPARAELQASNVEQLGVLCAGPVTSNAIDLLDSERMRTIVDELRDGVDVVIVAAPSLDTSGAIALLSTGSDVVLAGVAPRA